MYRLVTSSVQYIFSVYEIALSVSWADPLPTTLITQVIDLELNYCITSANHDKYVWQIHEQTPSTVGGNEGHLKASVKARQWTLSLDYF